MAACFSNQIQENTMSQSNLNNMIGQQVAQPFQDPDATRKELSGTSIDIYDTMFGGQQLIYAQSAAAMAIGTACKLSIAYVNGAIVHTMTAIPTATVNGCPIFFAKTTFGAANYWGWFVVSGNAIVAADSALAVDAAAFLHGAGRLGVTGVGVQVTGVNIVQASTATVVKLAQIPGAVSVIFVSDVSGWFVGMPVTGTGIQATTTITDLDPGGAVTLSLPTTAGGAVTVTGAYSATPIFWHVANVGNANTIS